MNLLIIIILIRLLANNESHGSVVINRPSACGIDPNIVKEINSYQNIVNYIMNDIIKHSGNEMFDLYKQFIDKFGARLSGSDALECSIDFMLNLTQSKGLNAETEEVDAPHWVRGEETCYMISPRAKNINILGVGYSISTPKEGIIADAIVVKSFHDLNRITDEDVKGKIVVFNPKWKGYGITAAYRSQGATKAAKKGAVAALVRSITPFSLYTLHAGAQFYKDDVNKIPVASITVEDANLLERFQENGERITLKIKMFNTYDVKKSRNSLIDLKGRENADKMVIVSGHIDSWDVGQGAMDDGGGMFISWFAPIVLHQLGFRPRRTIRAILWTSEELGLVGAKQYLKRHEYELDNINFIMESDMGTFIPLGLIVGGSQEAYCILSEVLKLFSPIDKIEMTDAPGTDISVITQKGVPGAALMNENDRYFWFYHSGADTMDVQKREDVVRCAAFWAAISYVLADMSIDIPRGL